MLRLILRLFLLWALSDALFNIHLGKNNVLFWDLDYAKEEYVVEVHTKYLDSSGDWVAVGFSNYGNVSDGSGDFCIAWKSHMLDPKSESAIQLTDVHIQNNSQIFKRDKQQDCLDFQYFTVNETIKWTFRRKFVTCDPHDYPLEEGTTHLHWALGVGPLYDIRGVSIGDAKDSGFERIRFLKNTEPQAKFDQRQTIPVDVLNSNVKVPGVETTYWCHIVKLPEFLSEKHHVVQFGAKIQKGNEELVHHMEVFHCEGDPKREFPMYSGPCDKTPKEISVCSRVIGAWAMGASPLIYPEKAGYPLGGPNFNLHVRLEIHYNNPLLKQDWIDSSGMRLLVTKQLREFDAGVIELGLEYSDKMSIPPRQLNFPLTGICNKECTSVGFGPDGITIFASQLHTHLTGSRVITRHFRRNSQSNDYEELPPLNWDNHYSTHYQEIRQLKSPTLVLPGDILLTTCEYNTESRPSITLGGFAISEEIYYPRSKLEVCKSSVSWKSLREYFHFMKEMEGQNIEPEGAVSKNYDGIRWTPYKAQRLSDFYNFSPIDMQCNQSDGTRFPGIWDQMPQTPLPPLPPKPNLNKACRIK